MLNITDGHKPAMLDAPTFAQPAVAAEVSHETLVRDLDFKRWWHALVRRRALFGAVFVVFVLFVALLTLLQPRTYTTSTKLIAGSANADGSASTQAAGSELPALNALLAMNGVQTAETYAELMQESAVVQQVATDLNLGVTPQVLASAVKVKPVTDTSILTIFATWRDPVTAARIANEFASVFVVHERQLVAKQADSTLAFLQQQLPQAEDRMRAAQVALAEYQARSGIADLTSQTQATIGNVAALDTKAQTAELDAKQAAAQLQAVQSELARTSPTVVVAKNQAGNPVAGQLETQVATLTAQLVAARQQYTENYPAVVSLRAQLATAQRELASKPKQVLAGQTTGPNPVFQQLTQQEATLQATIASAQSQAATVRAQRAAAAPALANLPEQTRRIGDLQRSAKSAQDFYDALQRKYQDATISKNTALSDVTVTQAADPRVYTSKPNIVLNLLIGLAVGLALALGAVFVAEFFDDRFRNEVDVRERLGVPVLASIPSVDRLALGDGDWIKPLSTEAFFGLVAALRYSSHTPPRTIAFTSPDQGDGKSTVAVNTAISLGLMKARVLVIDADLRRPSVHEKLSIANDTGLADVLVGMSTLEGAIKPTAHPGVSVLTSGHKAPNPVGLLQSPLFENVLAEVRAQYDFVVVDSPALRSIVDGVVLGLKTEGTVLVVNSKRSDSRAVRNALAKLRSVGSINLLGVVLNATRPDLRERNDYYLGAGQSLSLPLNAGG